jgi:antitoxin component YwqK of YwqJK toxin-antitoxin module
MKDLVEREGLFYKKFTDVPFTGKTKGLEQYAFLRGKEHGPSVWYYENGQLSSKGNYKDGKREGPWVFYNDDGTKDADGKCCDWHEGTGTYRNGKKVM